MSTFVTADPVRYETFMGRWSQHLAPAFVELAGVVSGERVLDVGCGTGNLTLALHAAKAVPTGLDLSAPCVAYARQRLGDPAVRLDVGDALHLPYPDGAFDRTLSMLALDVMPDPQRALAEMRRVTRPGGTIAALVPDVRSGLTPITLLWDTAAVLDPRAGALRDELMSAALGWPGGLAALFRRTYLTDRTETWTHTVCAYTSFEDYWSTFLTGYGRVGAYVLSLADDRRSALERRMRAAYGCGMPDGPRPFTMWCWVVRGQVPAL